VPDSFDPNSRHQRLFLTTKTKAMKSRKILVLALLATGALTACVGNTPTSKEPINTQELTSNQPEEHGTEIKADEIKLTTPLDATMVASGKGTYEMKCQGCHKLTGEKLVGPGWKGVTERRKPEWIMNMVTNVDMMLEKDPQAQKLLEECLVRMPNQNLNKDEARSVLEFMRNNDGVK
jgi:mono/diheme cytochrome c family protein